MKDFSALEVEVSLVPEEIEKININEISLVENTGEDIGRGTSRILFTEDNPNPIMKINSYKVNSNRVKIFLSPVESELN